VSRGAGDPPKQGFSAASGRVGASVFSPVAARVAEMRRAGHEIVPLHVGDTWLEPPPGCLPRDLALPAGTEPHKYLSDTRGLPSLIDALLERVREVHQLPFERDGIVVTAGATTGLGNVLGALLDPGDEVQLLAPYWPLIRGIVHAHHGFARDTPFYDRVRSADDAVRAVEATRGPRTKALYLSTPSNPTGRVLPRAWLEALAAWAREHDLWIVSDETYDGIVYTGEHVSIGRFAPERTLTSFSFSKNYGMAGYRVAYVVGPPAAIEVVHKLAVHAGYTAPTPSQYAALHALRTGSSWLDAARRQYQSVGMASARALGVEEPSGSCFLFVPVAAKLDQRGMDGFLHDCLDVGLQVAPGGACGHDYGDWVRVCYTAAPPDRVERAIAKLARLLGDPGSGSDR